MEYAPPKYNILIKYPYEIIFSQMVKKLPAFYETRSFIAVFKNGGHLSYSEPDNSKPRPRTPFRSELC